MKYIYIVVVLFVLSQLSFGQTVIPVMVGSSSTVNMDNDDDYAFNVGQVCVKPNQILNVSTDSIQISLGLPLGVLYMARTFGDELSVSKGYFSDYILVEWDIASYADQITRFKIYRRNLGATSWSLITSVAPENRIYQDNYIEAGKLYEYRVVAEGIDDVVLREYINYVEGVGFRSPTGIVTGRITYEGGNAVSNVQVMAETNDITPSYSMYLSGTNTSLIIKRFDSLTLANAMTFQSFVRFDDTSDAAIFSKGGQYSLSFVSGNLIFETADKSLIVAFSPTINTFYQITATCDENGSKLYVDGVLIGELVENISISPVYSMLFMGTHQTGSESIFLRGYLDEIRFWNKALDSTEVANTHSRYLSGNEIGLISYWRFNEGVGSAFYDISRSGYQFNGNHGANTGAAWSAVYPPRSKLWFKGICDDNGNYIISGLPYLTNGSSYTLAPVFENHEFNPSNTILFIGNGATTHNNINFTDVSAFDVTGNIVYENTQFPVKDVYLKVDGFYVQGPDNTPVVTDEMGNFTISVPIGDHYISVEKTGHEFTSAYFPQYDSLNNQPNYHTFENPVSGINFYDNTTVTLSGLIVGGPVEAAKNINSVMNPSVNNIGEVAVKLTTEGNYILDTNNLRTVSFNSDPSNGSYEIDLLPEKYIVSSEANIMTIGNTGGSLIFDRAEDLLVIDLQNAYTLINETDSMFEEVVVDDDIDTVFTRIDTVASYHKRRDWVYREPASFEVLRDNGSIILSDSMFISTTDSGNVDTIMLVQYDGGNLIHTFGKPVFSMAQQYNYVVEAFEEYVNRDNGDVDRVAVTDGIVRINNDLASISEEIEIPINENGEAEYAFMGGIPNIATPYTKNLNFTLQVSGQSSVSSDPIEGYLLGSRPTGNNFVTTGPNKIDFILRDPPGSSSQAFLEKGSTKVISTTQSISLGVAAGVNVTASLGPTITTSAGTPFFSKETEIETQIDLSVGVDIEASYEGTLNTTNTVSFTEAFYTSDDPAYIGANGDVYIGRSTNIVYGLSNNFGIKDTSDVIDSDTTGISSGAYTLALFNGLYFSPEFNTAFIFTQDHIINNLIPNLKMIRNLQFSNYPSKYSLVFNDIEDERYGTNNFDPIWEGNASSREHYYSGPSYVYTSVSDDEIDSVMYFNSQINQWEETLALNERQKVEASTDRNISFDAGAIYESSISTEGENSTTHAFSLGLSVTASTAVGAAVDGYGVSAEVYTTLSVGAGYELSQTNVVSNTIGFALADGDQGDYLSVDIKNCQSQNGPVFTTRGGQTSCPFEGQQITQYYEPGQHTLSFATMQIEVPFLSVDNPISPVIPETMPAYFILALSNQSEVDADTWYTLKVDAATNPDGAELTVDGMNLNAGVSVLVPGGETVYKTLGLTKGNPDVDVYEHIKIMMESLCDGDAFSEIEVSAYFEPACVPLEIQAPFDNWTVNAAMNDTLVVRIGGYNLQSDKFQDIHFQYRPTGTSMWLTNTVLVNDVALSNQDDVLDTIFMNDAPSVNVIWDMSSMMDREYDIRAVSHCSDGSDGTSEIYSGVLDGQRPQVFGSPQPSDGVLSSGEDIMVQFNEDIESGVLTPYNFSVKGVLNNSPLTQNASVLFDGVSGYVELPEAVSMANKSFTIEFWAKAQDITSGVLFSQGIDTSQSIELSFTSDSSLSVKIGSITQTGNLSFSTAVPSDAWHHYALVVDLETEHLLAYQNGLNIIDVLVPNLNYSGQGKVFVGKSSQTTPNWFSGNINELRIWSIARLQPDIIANKAVSLSGGEIGLYGYWTLDEAGGLIAEDKASQRHAGMFADWDVSNDRYAFEFDGTSQFVNMFTAGFAILPEMDYSIEFWFRNDTPTDTICFFSCGKGDGNEGDEFIERNMSICGTADGNMIVFSEGNALSVSSSNLFDNNWHHFALVVKREGSSSFYIDGELHNQYASSLLATPAAANMYLGVRKWWNLMGSGEDYYYNGRIDEFRMWNLARTKSNIELDKNAKLQGDEVGLLAYYPFEAYFEDMFGQLNIEATLINQKTSATDTAQTNTTESFSSIAPTIKEARPVQSIGFDFVANNDQIIITPDVGLATYYEKRILEITVEGIEDKHGNALSSPISWTAYVDKSQVKWQDQQLQFEKMVYDEQSFTSSIKNSSGAYISYNIENLPNWLSASPQSGSIGPLETLDILFTISTSLNIGTYNEDIYLHTDYDYYEKLSVSVNVKNEEPNWIINESDYQYSMSIIGMLTIEDIVSTDANDIVAVFSGDVCRGKAYLSYLESINAYEVFLDIYSNQDNNETLSFKVWDASKGHILVDVTPSVTFQSNTILGTPNTPVVINAKETVLTSVPIKSGWNWVSCNYQSTIFNNPNLFLESLNSSTNDQIKSQTQFVQYSPEFGWFGSLVEFNNTEMYMFKSNVSDTLIYSGIPLDTENYPLEYSNGWNWIGYTPDMIMPLNDALSNYTPSNDDVIKSRTAFSMYVDGVGWLGSLNQMEPGKGYMLSSQDTGSFWYPNDGLIKKSFSQKATNSSKFNEYPNNMTVVAKLQSSNPDLIINHDYTLNAIVNNEYRGANSSIEINGERLYFLTIHGNSDESSVSFIAKEDGVSYSVIEQIQYADNDMKGSINNPVLLTITNEVLSSELNTQNSETINCYPNPFKDDISFNFQVNNKQDLKLKILNTLGQKVKEIILTVNSAGLYTITWDGNNKYGEEQTPGVYYVNCNTDKQSVNFKIVKF